jgi:uncharacterized SAM-binding protein YcdF (DUF218 family)
VRRVVFVLAVGLLVLAVGGHRLWLPGIAEYLIVDDTPTSADVIAVFAGGRGERARHAAELYRRGLAPRILATGGETSYDIWTMCERRVTGAEITAKLLRDAGVPDGAVAVIPRGTSTYEEADVIRDYLTSHGYRAVIAVSSEYHTRRVSATLRHHLRSGNVAVQISPAWTPEFTPTEWWRGEHSLLFVASEYEKLIYYYLALL